MKLIIVESPAKTKTISKFLGKDYVVDASYGHIRDLPSRAAEMPSHIESESVKRFGVDLDGNFEPVYVVSPDSRKHVTRLKKLLKDADELLLATDEDREGEAISWHILQELKPKIPVKRITFHEITRQAVEAALRNPRDINEKVVRAQETRRILDRLFGYSLSPVLWRRVRPGLSAGRVQSVALRLIVEREEARRAFHSAEYWDVEADLAGPDGPFTAALSRVDGKRPAGGKDFSAETGRLLKPGSCVQIDGARAELLSGAGLDAQPWRVASVESKATRKRPKPPFTTSTLQQAASSKLGMSPRQTMSTAQRLYEGNTQRAVGEGLITYMRTDSLSMSREALGAMETRIRDAFGPEYTDGPRFYKNKSAGAQEAHEAIRPTNFDNTPERMSGHMNRDELALYTLIWNRALASQMTDARVDRTTVEFEAGEGDARARYRANGAITRFPGHLRAYGSVGEDMQLPELAEGDTVGRGGTRPDVTVDALRPVMHQTTPPARFTEASLIKRLEEEGIGRPSTYAPTVSTIQNRNYAVKKNGALLPTYLGMAVIDLLREHFQRYIELKFTARMETGLDSIAEGKQDWRDYLRVFYYGDGADEDGLSNRIDAKLPQIEFPRIPLGVDPKSGEPVTLRIGKNYVYAHVGNGDGDRRAALPVDLLIDELTVEKAVEIVEQREKSQEPLCVDPESGLNIYILNGPYGPYLQLGEVGEDDKKPKRVSLGKKTDLSKIDCAFALRLLSLPREIGVDPETGKPVRAGLGLYGPYVERSRVFASVENVETLFNIGLDEALERIRNKNKKPVLKELGAHPESGQDLQVLKGRYGPYVTDGKVNATIPKGDEPTDVTLEQAVELLKAAAVRKKTKKKTVRKKAAKKTTRKKTAKKAAPKKA